MGTTYGVNSYLCVKYRNYMTINYILITLSFFVPIIRLGFSSLNIKHKVNPKIFVVEWFLSGLLACLVQFLAVDIPIIQAHQTSITIFIALFARKIITFADESIVPILQEIRAKIILIITTKK